MDTQNLKAFVAVARSHSFSMAADKLHITQPAISKRIHQLEQQLDTMLFDRIGRKVSLTEAGRTLLPHAESILAAMHSARQAIADLSGEIKGELKLVTSHHIGLHRLPQLLREYSERYPLVELDIQFTNSSDAYAAVLKGECEVGIITEGSEQDDAVATTTVWRDVMHFVAAPQHPLSKLPIVTLADVSPYQGLLPERRFYTTQLVEELFTRNGLSMKLNLATNFLETIKALISAGYSWGVLPESMLQDNSLTRLNVRETTTGEVISLTRNLDCIYHRQRLISNAGKAFIDLLQQHATR